jgi:HEAT repeat protein
MPQGVPGGSELAWEALRRWETFREWEALLSTPICGASPALAAALPKLVEIEPRVVEHLLEDLANRNSEFGARMDAASTLKAMGPTPIDDDALAALASILSDGSDHRYVRRDVIEVLTALGARAARPAIIDTLVAALEKRDLSGEAAKCLAAMGDRADREEVLRALRGVLRPTEYDVGGDIKDAAIALGTICHGPDRPATIATLASFLGHETRGLRNAAIAGLVAAGSTTAPQVIGVVLPIVTDKGRADDVRAAGAEVVGKIRSDVQMPDVLPALVARLHDESDSTHVRAAVAEALGVLGHDESRESQLRSILDALVHLKAAHPEPFGWPKWAVFRGLEAMGKNAATDTSLQLLVAGIGGGLWAGHDEATRALGAMGPAAAKGFVLDAMVAKASSERDQDWIFFRSNNGPSLRAQLVSVLGKMGAAAARDDVVRLLVVALRERSHDYFSSSAAEALAAMGETAVAQVPIETLFALLHDQRHSEYTRADIARALGTLSAPSSTRAVVPALVARVADRGEREVVREAAADALGGMGARAATAECICALAFCLGERKPGKSDASTVSWHAAAALGRVQSAGGVRVIDGQPYRALDLARWRVRQHARQRSRRRTPKVRLTG